MRIPKSLQRFSEPSLIVIGDTEMAKFILAGGDALEEIGGVELPREKKTDKEASFTSGTRVGAPAFEAREEDRKKKFAVLVSKKIASLIRDGHAEKVYIAVPALVDGLIESKIPRDLRSRVIRRIPKDLLHLKMVDILKRFLEL
jgi:hypothetical protein